MKKLFDIFYYIFLGMICMIAVLLLISVFPITGNFKVLTVLSGSMEPAIHTGSIVAVKPIAEYKVGDIITFGKISKSSTPTTHRINEVKDTNGIKTYITKGDANNAPDNKEIRQSEVIGKVLFTVPYMGYAINAAKRPWGFALIIIIPALLVIFDEGKKIKDEITRLRNEKKHASENAKKEEAEQA